MRSAPASATDALPAVHSQPGRRVESALESRCAAHRQRSSVRRHSSMTVGTVPLLDGFPSASMKTIVGRRRGVHSWATPRIGRTWRSARLHPQRAVHPRPGRQIAGGGGRRVHDGRDAPWMSSTTPWAPMPKSAYARARTQKGPPRAACGRRPTRSALSSERRPSSRRTPRGSSGRGRVGLALRLRRRPPVRRAAPGHRSRRSASPRRAARRVLCEGRGSRGRPLHR
jgi:hypothetical protein